MRRCTCKSKRIDYFIPNLLLHAIRPSLITEAKQAEAIVASGDADLVAMARAMLWDPRWPWHAAAALGAQVVAPQQYWRSAPREAGNVIANAKLGMR